MKSIHYYIQYHCSPNCKDNFRKKRVSDKGLYKKLKVNVSKGLYRKLKVKVGEGGLKPLFKENVACNLNESQYWFGNT